MSDPLLAHVLREAPRLPFVSLLHWLERLLEVEVGAHEGASRVTLRHEPALAFAAGDISAASTTETEPAHVTVTSTFAGVTGAVSPLPLGLLDELAREAHGEQADGPLIALLQHRLLALLYRGLLKSDLARSGASAPAREWVLLLAGVPCPAHAGATALTAETLLSIAPLLVIHPENGERLRLGVEALFADLLQGAQVQVRLLEGGFVAIHESARARLGGALRLGRTSALGSRCRSPSAAIGLALGPLDPQACSALSPGGARCDALRALVRLLVPATVETEVALQPRQGLSAGLGCGSRLKRDAWLSGAAPPEPVRFTIV